MSYRQTYVVEYATENDAPRVSANMECMGGRLAIVQFGDMNEDVRKGRELAVAVEAFGAGECPRERVFKLAMGVLNA